MLFFRWTAFNYPTEFAFLVFGKKYNWLWISLKNRYFKFNSSSPVTLFAGNMFWWWHVSLFHSVNCQNICKFVTTTDLQFWLLLWSSLLLDPAWSRPVSSDKLEVLSLSAHVTALPLIAQVLECIREWLFGKTPGACFSVRY